MPASERNNSAVRCGIPPREAATYRISPGRFFAKAINSGSALTPSDGATAMKNGCSPIKPIGTKSRLTSKVSFCVTGSTMRPPCCRLIERVAVRLGGNSSLRREQAARARPIDNEHLLTPRLAEAFCDHSPKHVGCGACRGLEDDFDGLGWEALGLRGRSGERCHGQNRQHRDRECRPERSH